MSAIIRCSSLPGWPDCARRVAARTFTVLVEPYFRLRHIPTHVGANVGSAVHAGAARSLENMVEHAGQLGNEREAIDAGEAEFHRRVNEEGVRWDDVTPQVDYAKRQIARMIRVYRLFAQQLNPVAVEERLEADLGDGFVLSGQKDSLCREPTTLRDLKTGKFQRWNVPQYGAYSVLDASHGRPPIERLTEDYLKRVPLQDDQPSVAVTQFDPAIAENAAIDIIDDMKRAIGEFQRRIAAGDRPPEGAFLANPASMLCSDRFCPAHSTPFCRMHKGAK